jgi:hypothetical protein
VYLDGKGRDYAVKRVARGAFRSEGDGLARGYVKPKRNLKYNTGTKSVNISCAISAQKTLIWHVVPGNWNGDRAAAMYTTALAPALRRANPGAKRFTILEDNDPTGYKSGKGLQAKEDSGISLFEIPKRSPDLNPLDYGFWDIINRKMRTQEKKHRPSFRESKEKYLARLRRAAMGVPSAVLSKLVKSMRRRCQALADVHGGHFEE